jgi:hypothetical protein
MGLPRTGSQSLRSLWAVRRRSRPSFDASNWAQPGDSLDEHDVLWAQYCVFVDLFKHYLEIVWKASVGYYFVTGAALAYYFDRVTAEPGPLPLLLLFVSVVSLGCVVIFLRGARDLVELRNLLDAIALRLRLPGRPHVEFAVEFVLFNVVFMLLVLLAVVALFAFQVDRLGWP